MRGKRSGKSGVCSYCGGVHPKGKKPGRRRRPRGHKDGQGRVAARESA